MSARGEPTAPRQPPRLSAVFLAQARLFVRLFRWIPALLVVIGGFLVFGWMELPDPVPRMYVLFPPLLFMSLFWAGVVWHDEGPARRGYHWSLPAARTAHDLVRLLVGGVYLIALFAVFILLGLAFAAADGHLEFVLGAAPVFWVNILAAPLIAYLLVSVLALGTNRPALWLLVLFASYLALIGAFGKLGLHSISGALESIVDGSYGIGTALMWGYVNEFVRLDATEGLGFDAGTWLIGVALWLALLTALCIAVAATHPDRIALGRFSTRSRGTSSD